MSCPLPNAHGRLTQADLLWHQTSAAYDDVDSFTANLNATIEALRNVTFVLQNEHEKIPEFTRWYAGWQARLKQDAVANWLHNARTTVVHRADLDVDSVAIATVHTNLDLARTSIPLPPLIPTWLACQDLAARLPEPFASKRRDLAFSVERRWGVAQFPGRELLDLLAHVHGMLSCMLREAHEKCEAPYDPTQHDGADVVLIDGVLPCMRETTSQRTVRMSLETGEALRVRRLERQSTATPEMAVARYGSIARIPSTRDPFLFADGLLPLAKTILVKDGYHVRMVWLLTERGWTQGIVDAKDRVEKYIIMRQLADDVRRLGASAFVEIAEVWVASVADFGEGRLPEEARRRQEALVVTAFASIGRFSSKVTLFSRNLFGKIKLEPTVEMKDDVPTYLAPICHVWGLPTPGHAEG